MRTTLFLTTVAMASCGQLLQADPGDLPELKPTERVQRLNSVLPTTGDPTAKLLAIDWKIQFRTYYNYTGDLNGNPIVSSKVVDDGSGWSQYEYQNINERHVTMYDFDSERRISAQYDSYVRMPEVRGQLLLHKEFHRDAEGQIVQTDVYDANDQYRYSTFTSFDGEGRVDSETNGAGEVTEYTYGNNQVTISVQGSSVSSQLTFDGNGEVTSEALQYEDGSFSRFQYGYDSNGNLTSVQYPDGSTASCEYDAFGRQIHRIYSDGSQTAFEYDDYGRCTQEETQDPDGANVELILHTYQGFRCVHEDSSSTGATDFSYDNAGRLIQKSNSDGTYTYSYDTLGRLSSETDPAGNTTEYSYDYANRLTESVQHGADGAELNRESFTPTPSVSRVHDDWVYDTYSGSTSPGGDEPDGLLTVPPELLWLQEAVFDGVNDYRASQGQPPLELDPFLTSLCQQHCENMANGVVDPGHDGLMERAQAARDYYGGTRNFGENVALNMGFFNPAQTAIQGWINSPGHERQMVGSFNLTGIGVTEVGGYYYFTQIFVLTN